MYCSKCGKENTGTSKFCFSCGNQLSVQSPSKQDVPQVVKIPLAKNRSVMIITVIVAFVGLMVGLSIGIRNGIEAQKITVEEGWLGPSGKELAFGQKVASFIGGFFGGTDPGIGEERGIVRIVKEGHFNRYPNKTIGVAFNKFFDSPSWKHFLAQDGKDIVEFNGKGTFNGEPVNVKIQFTVVDKKGGAFETTSFALNDVPQDLLSLEGLLSNIYGQ